MTSRSCCKASHRSSILLQEISTHYRLVRLQREATGAWAVLIPSLIRSQLPKCSQMVTDGHIGGGNMAWKLISGCRRGSLPLYAIISLGQEGG